MLSISVPSRSKSRALIVIVLNVLNLISALDALFETGFDERIEIAVEHLLRRAHFEVGAQVLDAALVQNVGADLVAPADIGLGVFELLLLFLPLAHLVV